MASFLIALVIVALLAAIFPLGESDNNTTHRED